MASKPTKGFREGLKEVVEDLQADTLLAEVNAIGGGHDEKVYIDRASNQAISAIQSLVLDLIGGDEVPNPPLKHDGTDDWREGVFDGKNNLRQALREKVQ